MLCLNVGCHDIHIKDFINIDNDPEMKPELLWDARHLKEKFPDNTIDFIFCSHFIEHLTFTEAQQLIKDFYDMLKPYCSCVIVVPDFYKVEGLVIEELERIIMAEGTHKSLFNGYRTRKILKEANFAAFEITVKDIPWCRFQEVGWQSACLGIKHPTVVFPRG
jgi:predicted SAM-dependent methyltransferase